MKSTAGADVADSPGANSDTESRTLSMADSRRDWTDGSPPDLTAEVGDADPALVGSTEPLVAEGAVLPEPAPPVSGAGLKPGSGRFGDRVFFGLTAGASGF